MLSLPAVMVPIMELFTPLFSRRVWPQAQALAVGAILTPGSRTVAACLRVLGLADTKRFERYHRVLSRDKGRGEDTRSGHVPRRGQEQPRAPGDQQRPQVGVHVAGGLVRRHEAGGGVGHGGRGMAQPGDGCGGPTPVWWTVSLYAAVASVSILLSYSIGLR